MRKFCVGLIYKITNKINGKAYIGQTTKSLAERWAGHTKAAKLGCKYALHCAIRKYGPENFIKRVLKRVTEPLLDAAEINRIAFHDTFKHGYNMTAGGAGAPVSAAAHRRQGRSLHKFYAEHPDFLEDRTVSMPIREKISKTLTGRKLTKKHKSAISRGERKRKASGIPWHTLEGTKRISEASKNRIWTTEQRKRIGVAGRGRKQSEDTKLKRAATLKKYYEDHPEARKAIGEKLKGRKRTEATKAKLREIQSNRPPITEAARRNMRAASAKRWARPHPPYAYSEEGYAKLVAAAHAAKEARHAAKKAA